MRAEGLHNVEVEIAGGLSVRQAGHAAHSAWGNYPQFIALSSYKQQELWKSKKEMFKELKEQVYL